MMITPKDRNSLDAFDWTVGRSLSDHDPSAPTLGDYPELKPVISSALDAAISSFYPEEIDAQLRAYLERVTVTATIAVYAPFARAAARAGHGVRDSRVLVAADASRAAGSLADGASETAAALHARTDAIAVTVANDATVAAKLVADAAAAQENETEVAATAAAMTVVVHHAAVEIDSERTRAASLVEQSASVAALKVAAKADTVAVWTELKYSQAASDLRTIALQTCYQVAFNVATSAGEAVLADGMPD
jgi:hypothetical protein